MSSPRVTSQSGHQVLERRFLLLTMLVAIAFFMQGLDTTILNTALASMADSLNENPLKMHNVIVAYVLAVAVCIPLSGWLADRFGLRSTFLFAIIVFTVASLGCAASNSINELIIWRVVQGIGGAFLLPIGRLSLLKVIPRNQFVSAMSIMSVAGLLGPLMGPTLGGWLVEFYSWHWIFLINVPIGLLGILLTFKVMPSLREEHLPKFDFFGFVLLGILMVGLSLALESVINHSIASWLSALFALAGVAAFFVYLRHAHNHSNALFTGRLFRQNPNFTLGILGNFVARFSSNAMPFVIPLMLQVGFHITPFQAGLMMLPLAIGSLAAKPITRLIIQWGGYRKVLIINTVLMGLFIASFALASKETPEWVRVLHFFAYGICNSLQFVAMNTFTLKDLSQQDASSGNSLLSLVMMLSTSMGVALASLMINFFQGFEHNGDVVGAFRYTLISLGILNALSLIVFLRVAKEER